MRPVARADRARRAVGRERPHHGRERHGQGHRRAGAARRLGPHAARALVTVNAGGLSEGVFESELFGHVKGAFTDAKTDRVGRFELADGGTLFLDEIANVPLNLQPKLLRVLETGDFERVGSSRTRHVNVRIVSATNANLGEEVGSGRFRQDLLFRLNTIEIALPPLRSRREDIPALATHFLRQHAQRYRKTLTGFEPAALQALLDHPWPGNIRELDHAVERGVLMAQGAVIRARRARAADRSRFDVARRGHEPRRGRGVPHQEGHGALRRQRQPGRQGARPEPQRALPPAAALRALGEACRDSGCRDWGFAHRIPPWHPRRLTRPPVLTPASSRELTVPGSAPDSRIRFDQRILLLALAAGFPAALVALILLWTGTYTPKVQWTLTVLVVGVWAGCSFSVRHRVVLPLQTLSNLLAALRESDFSIRARGASGDDPLGAVMLEVNVLAADAARPAARRARSRRAAPHGDGGDRRGGVHVRRRPAPAARQPRGRAAARPARRAAARADGRRARTCARASRDRRRASPTSRFPARRRGGKCGARRSAQDGRPHQLLVLADVSRPLRDEERQAWQRLIRVIGHEINNSLAPIKSIAGSLESHPRPRRPARGLERRHAPRAGRDRRALGFAQPLHHRVRAAREAARAAPRLGRRSSALVRRVAGVETRLAVRIDAGPDLTIRADPDQLEQLLINLLRNAVDAALETGGGVDDRLDARRTDARSLDRRRRGGAAERVEPLRAVLHDQAGRVGYRPRAQPPDCRSARRIADAREPRGRQAAAPTCACRVTRSFPRRRGATRREDHHRGAELRRLEGSPRRRRGTACAPGSRDAVHDRIPARVKDTTGFAAQCGAIGARSVIRSVTLCLGGDLPVRTSVHRPARRGRRRAARPRRPGPARRASARRT